MATKKAPPMVLLEKKEGETLLTKRVPQSRVAELKKAGWKPSDIYKRKGVPVPKE